MTRNRKTAWIVCYRYRIIDAPHRLEGDGDFQVDHVERVIWLAPGLSPCRREYVLEVAISRACAQVESLAPAVG